MHRRNLLLPRIMDDTPDASSSFAFAFDKINIIQIHSNVFCNRKYGLEKFGIDKEPGWLGNSQCVLDFE